MIKENYNALAKEFVSNLLNFTNTDITPAQVPAHTVFATVIYLVPAKIAVFGIFVTHPVETATLAPSQDIAFAKQVIQSALITKLVPPARPVEFVLTNTLSTTIPSPPTSMMLTSPVVRVEDTMSF
jgi:hypothetical protein